MAELSTLARPYAKAAFEYAREKNALEPVVRAVGHRRGRELANAGMAARAGQSRP